MPSGSSLSAVCFSLVPCDSRRWKQKRMDETRDVKCGHGKPVAQIRQISRGWSRMVFRFAVHVLGLRRPLFRCSERLATVSSRSGLRPLPFGQPLFVKQPWLRLATCAACSTTVLLWWLSLAPSNNRRWQADVSEKAWADLHDDQVVIHNVRNCDYRSEFDYTCRWETRTYDLSQLRGMDAYFVH